MYSSLEEELFFSQKVIIQKKYTNLELKLLHFFHEKTKIYAENIIIIKNFILFFVRNDIYFKAKVFLSSLRKQFNSKKILIIRVENTLITLLFSFFPDPYINNVKLEINKKTGENLINLSFISFEERGIAIGRSGEYIKAVNEIFKNNVSFEKYATFEKYKIPLKIKCEFIPLAKEHPSDR